MKLTAILLASVFSVSPALADGYRPAVLVSVQMFDRAMHPRDERERRETPSQSRPADSIVAEKSGDADAKSKASKRPLPPRAHVWLT